MYRTIFVEIFDYLDAYFMDEFIVIKRTDYDKDNCVMFTQERYAHQFVNEITEVKERHLKGTRFKDFVFRIEGHKVYFTYKPLKVNVNMSIIQNGNNCQASTGNSAKNVMGRVDFLNFHLVEWVKTLFKNKRVIVPLAPDVFVKSIVTIGDHTTVTLSTGEIICRKSKTVNLIDSMVIFE